ncbi:hypothetical protein NPIL_75591, partial [Nephila pilipes]
PPDTEIPALLPLASPDVVVVAWRKLEVLLLLLSASPLKTEWRFRLLLFASPPFLFASSFGALLVAHHNRHSIAKLGHEFHYCSYAGRINFHRSQ